MSRNLGQNLNMEGKMFKNKPPSGRFNVKTYWKNLISLMSKECANVVEASAPARMLARWAGLCIYDFAVLPNNAIKATINLLGLAPCVLLLTLYTWCSFYANANQQSILGIFYKTKMKYHGELFTAALSYIVMLYAMIILCFSLAQKSEFWEELLKLDCTLRDHGIKDNFRKHRMSLVQVVVGVVLLEGVKMFTTCFTFVSWNLELPLCKLFYMICTFHIMMFSLNQYTYCLAILAKRYGNINKILLGAIDIKSHIVSRDTLAKATDETPGRFHDSSAHHETKALDKINAASKLYAKIHAIGVAFDTRVGKLIVMMIFLNFISIILSMFYLMEATAGGLYRDVKKYLFFVNCNFQEIFFGTFVIFFIVSASEIVYNEAKRTAHITHEIINQQISEEITKTATNLSMQLLHQRHTFSAYGLLNIDRSLLLTVLGSITTYLIILLQFATRTTIEDMFDQAQEANATNV